MLASMQERLLQNHGFKMFLAVSEYQKVLQFIAARCVAENWMNKGDYVQILRS